MSLDIDKERVAFEAWAIGPEGPYGGKVWLRKSGGRYTENQVESNWHGWLAAKRAATQPAPIPAQTGTLCDCGCNDPVADNQLDMLEFLANRFEHAGVSSLVAEKYARDIRAILAARNALTDEAKDAARIISGTTQCTCPSGDGSLRWPCAQHQPEEVTGDKNG